MNPYFSHSDVTDKFGHSMSRFIKREPQVVHLHPSIISTSDGGVGMPLNAEGNFSASKRRLVDLGEPIDPEDAVSYRFFDKKIRSTVDNAISNLKIYTNTENAKIRLDVDSVLDNVKQEFAKTLETSIDKINNNFHKNIEEAKSSTDLIVTLLIDKTKTDFLQKLNSISSSFDQRADNAVKKSVDELNKNLEKMESLVQLTKKDIISNFKNESDKINSKIATDLLNVKNELIAADSKMGTSISSLQTQLTLLQNNFKTNVTKILNDVLENFRTNVKTDLLNQASKLDEIKNLFTPLKTELNNKVDSEIQPLKTQINNLVSKTIPSDMWKTKIQNDIFDSVKTLISKEMETLNSTVSNQTNNAKLEMQNNILTEANKLRSELKLLYKPLEGIEEKTKEDMTKIKNELENKISTFNLNFETSLQEKIKEKVIKKISEDLKPLASTVEDIRLDLQEIKTSFPKSLEEKSQTLTTKCNIDRTAAIEDIKNKVIKKLTDDLKPMADDIEKIRLDLLDVKTTYPRKIEEKATSILSEVESKRLKLRSLLDVKIDEIKNIIPKTG